MFHMYTSKAIPRLLADIGEFLVMKSADRKSSFIAVRARQECGRATCIENSYPQEQIPQEKTQKRNREHSL